MNKLPIYFGYAGIVPFVLMTFVFLFAGEKAQVLGILQLSYASMILSFLGGVHWGQAIPSNHKKQLSFSMIPTVAGLILLFIYIFGFHFFATLGFAAMFWITYEADKKLMPIEYIPPGYFVFRRNLTIIVVCLLVISAFTLI